MMMMTMMLLLLIMMMPLVLEWTIVKNVIDADVVVAAAAVERMFGHYSRPSRY
jgi:hypothetical protein